MKEIIGASAIIILLLFILNNFVGYERVTIKSDGSGYYDYLPALFIYGDFPGINNNKSGTYSDRINKSDVYHNYKNIRYNKYPCGTALLLFPFFTYAHLTASIQGHNNDGFSKPYQKAVFMAAIFYLFLSLIFLRKLLLLFQLSEFTIFITQLLVVFSTSISNYVNFDPSFSHIYSFFAITAFLFFVKSFFTAKKINHFLLSCLFLGLIIILRQINFIIVLFVPFLAGSSAYFKAGISFLLKKKLSISIGILLLSGIVFIQLFLWKIQTGKFIFDSYQGEGFNFLTPAFFNILFSYKKGLFIYAPIIFIALGGEFILLRNKQHYAFFSWLLFFIILTYVLSSWHDWEYGCSYGARAYIDFYSVIFILFGIFLEAARRLFKIFLLIASLLTAPVSVIQSKQYKEYILLWHGMDKEKYWTVFLMQEQRFKGLLWKREYNFNSHLTYNIHSESLNDIIIEPNVIQNIYSQCSNNIVGFEKVNMIQVRFENNFEKKEDSRIELSIIDSLDNYLFYDYKIPLIHYNEKGLDKFQLGEFNYEVPTINKKSNVKITLKIIAQNKQAVLKNLKVNFLEYHY